MHDWNKYIITYSHDWVCQFYYAVHHKQSLIDASAEENALYCSFWIAPWYAWICIKTACLSERSADMVKKNVDYTYTYMHTYRLGDRQTALWQRDRQGCLHTQLNIMHVFNWYIYLQSMSSTTMFRNVNVNYDDQLKTSIDYHKTKWFMLTHTWKYHTNSAALFWPRTSHIWFNNKLLAYTKWSNCQG